MIKDEVEAMLIQHGMLLDMKIEGGNPPMTILRNVFSVMMYEERKYDWHWWIMGEFWARDLMTEQPILKQVSAAVRDEMTLQDIVFMNGFGIIPLDFYPEYAGVKGVV